MARPLGTWLIPILAIGAVCGTALLGCAGSGPAAGKPSGWLTGSDEQRWATVARQLRGFDVAMIEVGHRYIELYWAGRDGNWPFARYQVEKIETTIRRAIERRPKRGPFARAFLAQALPPVTDAIRRADRDAFDRSFTALTDACNNCHRLERVGFVTVRVPEHRVSPVRPFEKRAEGAGHRSGSVPSGSACIRGSRDSLRDRDVAFVAGFFECGCSPPVRVRAARDELPWRCAACDQIPTLRQGSTPPRTARGG